MRNKIFRVLATLAALATLGACVAANYAKDLDSCLSAGDRAAINDCMCGVAQKYGRACTPFEDPSDAGAE